MIWLHWLLLAVVAYGTVQLLLAATDDRPERFNDVDELAERDR